MGASRGARDRRGDCVWLSTGILDDPQVRALTDDEFKFKMLAAAFKGEHNVFSKHIRFTPPDESSEAGG